MISLPKKARVPKYKILQYDSGLLPYAEIISSRMEYFENTRKALGDLSSFANGYLYFGIARCEGGWVYREWAPGADEMHLTGDFNNWSGDVVMCESDKGIYSNAVTLTEPGGIKIRRDRDWKVDRGGTMAAFDQAFEVTQGGPNINLEAGEYYVIYDMNLETITIRKL